MKYELEQLVKKQLGIDNDIEYSDFVRDFRSADDGHDGFIYYEDTVKFWKKHKKLIMESLKEDADCCETSIVEFVESFRILESTSLDDIAKALYGQYKEDYDHIYNCLAWYALETAIEKERERIDA